MFRGCAQRPLKCASRIARGFVTSLGDLVARKGGVWGLGCRVLGFRV